jgi:hypothetical protein
VSEKSETYRLQMLRRLQNRYSKGDPPEVLEAEKMIAKFRKEQAEATEQIARASAPLQDSDLCPACWIMHGDRVPLISAPHHDPDRFDRMMCRKCDYNEDRPAP